jgi:hypothetical protein
LLRWTKIENGNIAHPGLFEIFYLASSARILESWPKVSLNLRHEKLREKNSTLHGHIPGRSNVGEI